MLKHIQRRATRQRADFAGYLWDGAYLRQGRVAEGLWGITPRRLPLLTLAKIRSRQMHELSPGRP